MIWIDYLFLRDNLVQSVSAVDGVLFLAALEHRNPDCVVYFDFNLNEFVTALLRLGSVFIHYSV